MKRAAFEHPKLLALASELGLERWGAVGILESLWAFTARFAPQGNVGRFTDAEIARGVGWLLKRPEDLLQPLIRNGWVDPCGANRLIVHDWADHADQTVKKYLNRTGLAFVHPCPENVRTWISSEVDPPVPVPVPVPVPEPAPAPPPKRPRRSAANGLTDPPDDLDADGWERLWALLDRQRPWLVTDHSEIAPHCHPRWVKQTVQETLAWWRSTGRRRKDWVMTCANRIYSEDARRWEQRGEAPPIPTGFRKEHA